MSRDAIPQPIVFDERSKRSTVEFCDQHHESYRCMLVRGHDGQHEAVGNQGVLKWSLLPR